MKEKILKFLKGHKLLVGIGFGAICVAIIAAIVVSLLLQPDTEEKKTSARIPTERVVMGPKTSVLFYQDFNNLEREMTDGGGFSGGDSGLNVIERITEGENSYVKMSYNKNEYCAYKATTTGVGLEDTEFIEISLSTDGTAIPEMVLCYPYDRNTTNSNPRRNFFTIRQDGSIVVKSSTLEGVETIVDVLEPGKWIKLGIKFTPTDGRYTVYQYNQTTGSWDEKVTNLNVPSVISPSYVRFQILTKEENVGTGILFDDFGVYTASTFIDLTKVEIPSPIKVETGPDVEMEHPEMADIGNDGIVVMAGKGYAYVGEEKVSLAANTSGIEIAVEEETGWFKAFFQSIINFFKNLFGMNVEEHSETYKDILVSGDFIEKYLGVEVEDSSKLYAIGDIAKEAGRNVVYDDRDLMVITNSEIQLDAEEDVKLLTMLYGLFETGEVVSNYAAAPVFDQEAIDKAIDTYAAAFPEAFVGTKAANKSANALYYLTLIARSYPDAKHSKKDVTVVDAALKKLHVFIDGGGEPFASAGCWFGHGVVSSCFTLIKNTDVIYSQLTEEDIDRMDTIMAALAIAGNWQYNDANEYSTSFDLQGNMNDNANYRNTYLTIVLNAALYFGPDKLNEIYTTFNYDTYMDKFQKYGFTNIYDKWIDIGYSNAKELMETGGDAYLIGQNGDYFASTVGKYAGTGKGVKIPFSYNGLGLEDITEIFSEYLVAYTYAWKTISEYGTPDTISHCYIMSENKTSPLEGQMGMMLEYATTDSGDIRSKTSYCFDSFMNVIPLFTNMKLLSGWDSSTQRMCELDNRIWVGNEDMIYKMIEGYHGRAISVNYEEYEYDYTSSGYQFLKDIWYNFHCMQHTDITITKDPEKEALTEIPEAEPKEGDGITPPEGAWEAVVKQHGNVMSDKSFYRFIEEGKAYVSGKVEFDFVIPDGIDQNDYNVVVMLDQQDKNRMYTDFNILFRLMSGWIEVYNGAASVSDYIPTELRFGPNYRFHVEWEWDCETKSSQIKLTQTWPETKKEVSYTSKKLKFRATGDSIEGINSLVLVKNDVGSPFWVENFNLVETGPIVDIVESEKDLVRIPGAYYQNDFNDKDRKLSYNANSNSKGNDFSVYWNEESKNGWADLKVACEKNGYFRPKITGAKANETLVVEMELSTDGKVPNSRVIFPYKETLAAEKTSNFTIMEMKNGEIKSGGEHVATIKKGSWTRIGIIYTPATGEYAIYEYNSKTDTYERRVASATDPSVIAPTYMNVHISDKQTKGSNLLLDDISIYEGSEFYFNKKIDTTGIVVKKLNKVKTPDGYYYYSDYNVENCDVKYDAQTKSKGGYTYSQGLDANGNGYMSVNSVAGTTTSDFFRAKVEGAENGDYIITEIDLRAGIDGTPKFTFMYDYNKVNGSTKASTLFTVSEEKGKVLGAKTVIASLKSDKWSRIGVILNQKTGDYTLYRYNEATKTYVWMASGKGTPTKEGFPTFVGLAISAPKSETITRSVHVDNFYVYGSSTPQFKNVTTGTKPQFDGTYYSQDYSDEDTWDIGFDAYDGGGFDYTRKVDADGNAYVKMASKSDSNAYDYFKVNLKDIDKDPNGSVVVEFALRAGKKGSPYFSFQFIPAEGKTKTVLNVEKGDFKVLGSSALLATLSSDSWTRIGMILNLDTGAYTLYEYDEASNTYMWREEGKRQLDDGYPTWMRFSFAKRDEASNHSLDLDNFKIYSGTAFANAITGEKVEGDYYAQDYNVAKFITADATIKSSSGYEFTQGVEVDGNGYLKVTSKEGENSGSYFRADVSGVSEEDSIVVEMKLRAGQSGVPKIGFYFDRTTSAHTAFSIADSGNSAYKGDVTIAPITTDSWAQIGFILNRKTGEYTIYRNVEDTYVAMATGSTTFSSGKPTYFGFNISEPGEGNTREFHVDDFMVYGGTEFREGDIADGSNAGDIELNTVIADGALNIASANTNTELLNSALSDDERISVLLGKNAVLTLNAANVAEDSNDRTIVTEALDGRTLGSLFSINLTKQVGETAATEVTSVSEELQFTVTIPDSLKNTNENLKREYEIIRVDNGVATSVESTFDTQTGTVTFSTDKFGTFAIVYKDVINVQGYVEDFNDETSLALTLKSASARRYEDDYSEQIAAYARAHTSTNDATKQDFYGKRTEGENSYLYMRSSGKLTSGNPYYTSFTFKNIDVDMNGKPLWIEMDLKALEQRVDRYEFYVNGTKLFQETKAKGIASTDSHALGETEFSTLSLKFADGQCYAYINGENEIALGEFTLGAFESFQIKIYPSTDDVLETGNAGICIDNVAVYADATRLPVFANATTNTNTLVLDTIKFNLMQRLMQKVMFFSKMG